MSLINSIFQHIKFYSLANLLGKGANVVIFLIIAKVFSVQEFANYVTLMIAVELAIVILLFGVDSYIMRAQSSSSFDVTLEFIKFNLLVNFVFSIIIALIYSLNYITTYNFLLLLSLNIYLFYRVFEKLFTNYLIRSQQSKGFMKVTFFISYFQLSLILIAFYFNFLNITNYFFMLSSAIIILIFFILIKFRNEKIYSLNIESFKINIFTISSSIKAAFPFLGKNLIGSVNLYSSRILLAAFASPIELAAYGFYLALYFKAISLLSVVSATFIPMMKERIDQIKLVQLKIRKYELLYLFLVLILCLSLLISYANFNFFQNILLVFIKKEYIEMIEIGFIFIFCFFASIAIMIYDFWQYSLENVAKKILTISATFTILSVAGYAIILQSYGTKEIALYYLFLNIMMLIVSRRYFYQIQSRKVI